MNWVRQLHSAEGIARIIGAGGLLVLPLIVFAETGLLVGFFLPGDSLLITAGVLANPLNPNHVPELQIGFLNLILILAATIGNQTGYWLGNRAGVSVWKRPDSRLFKKKHLQAAHAFYERYGGLSVVAARYIPIVRTFVPFVAGMARMPYRKFVLWDIAGGILWISSLLWIGFYLGQTPLAKSLDRIIVLVIFVSILPMLFGAIKAKWGSKSTAAALLLAFAMASSSPARAVEYERKFDSRRVQAVKLRIGAGKATVVTGSEVSVEARYIHFDQRHCLFSAELEGATLVIEARMNTHRFIQTPCEVSVQLTLPRDLKRIELSASSGSLDVRGVESQLVKIDVGTGKVALFYPKRAKGRFQRRLEALVGSGELEVKAPKETRVFSELKAGSSDFQNHVRQARNRASADLVVSVKKGGGEIRVEPN